jgi:hypothetical protein
MTPFEQQVAWALAPVLLDLDNELSDPQVPYILAPEDLAERLAPRVAAAISAMGAAHSDGVHWNVEGCETCALNVQFGVPAALAALRGHLGERSR